MSRSIKFRNSTYLDTSSIVHNKVILKDYLNNKINRFTCKLAETKENNYCTFAGMHDETNNFDRRVYMYITVGNNMRNVCRIF